MPSKDNFTITKKMPKGKTEVVTLGKNNNKNRNKNKVTSFYFSELKEKHRITTNTNDMYDSSTNTVTK